MLLGVKQMLDDITRESTRPLRMRLVSPRAVPHAHLQMVLPREFVQASVDGEKIEGSEILVEQRCSLPLMFYNLPEDGVEITLSVQSMATIDATLTDYSNGLPEIPGMGIEPRPPELVPAPYDFRDPTVVSKSLEL